MSAGSGSEIAEIDPVTLERLDRMWDAIKGKPYSFVADESAEWLITPALRLAGAYPKLRAEIERQRVLLERYQKRSSN